MVPRNENLVRVGEFYEPVEEVEHFSLCPVVCEVTAMHDDICLRKPFQFSVAAMRVGDLEDSHKSRISPHIDWSNKQFENNVIFLFHPSLDAIIDAFLNIL